MIRNKSEFYLLSFTWGIVMSIIGCIAAIGLLITKHTPKKWGYCLHFEVGNGWGGVNLGPVIITNKNPSRYTKEHEHGHAHQNCIYGPFMIVISVMSFFRYWYRELKYNRKGLTPPTAYDDAWYEGNATKTGKAFMDWYDNNTK
jgi:hypothetical protein